MTKGLHVPSEIGKLRKVCLHRPGDELLILPPDELERLLFDDVRSWRSRSRSTTPSPRS